MKKLFTVTVVLGFFLLGVMEYPIETLAVSVAILALYQYAVLIGAVGLEKRVNRLDDNKYSENVNYEYDIRELQRQLYELENKVEDLEIKCEDKK